MLVYVSGGSGSGKSAFAESLIVQSGIRERTYIATMAPFGQEGQIRIARHRALRGGKGFTTIEKLRGLAEIEVPAGCAALLEDLTNLFANEWFGTEGKPGAPAQAAAQVLDGLCHLNDTASLLVVVGNDLFSDGAEYDAEMMEYLRNLAALNCAAAAMADEVYEVVCGIPIRHKGHPHINKGASQI